MDRVTVSEAAARLGVTPDAVRQRIRRNTIEYDKDEDGRYHVYMTEQEGRHDGVTKDLADRLLDENEWLRRELERKDAILLNMTEAMKALNPPPDTSSPEARGSPQTASEGRSDTQEAPPEDESPSRWRRWFGLS